MTDELILYENRYCAFVDILGFRELVARLSASAENVRTLRSLLQKVHEPREFSPQQIRAQSISDAVALSTDATMDGISALLGTLTILAVDLLAEGYLVRGAVVKGPLFHDERMVFGKALVDAYHLETEVAKFPRIVVVREVREDILKGKPDLMAKLKQAPDGPMYIDVLAPVVRLAKRLSAPYYKPNDAERKLHLRFSQIKDRLQTRFEESMDEPRHFEKVQWFARYWNKSVSGTDYQKVLGASLNFF